MAGTGVAIAVGDAIPLLDDNGSGVYIKGRNTAHDFRMGLLGAQFQQASDGISARGGVLITRWDGTSYDFDVLPQGTPDQTVTVKAGRAIVPRTGQGGYLITMETDQVVTLPVASTTNTRVDLVCLAMFDKGAFGADSAHGPQIWVEQGSLGGGAPATPAGMLKLKEVARAVNGNAISAGMLTDRRYVTGMNQGIRPYVGSEINGSGIIGMAGVTPNEVRFGPSQLERWNISSNAWDPITFPLGSSGYAEYTQTTAQGVATSTNQRMLFQSNPTPSGDISSATVSGGTEFTVSRPGVWLITGTMRYNGASGPTAFERAAILSTTSATADRFGGMNNEPPRVNGEGATPEWIGTQLGFSGTRRFTASDNKFALWLWQNAGATISTNIDRGPNKLCATWLRP